MENANGGEINWKGRRFISKHIIHPPSLPSLLPPSLPASHRRSSKTTKKRTRPTYGPSTPG